MKERVLRIFKQVPKDVDAIIIMNDTTPNLDLSFFYATGLDSGLFEKCAVILWPDGRSEVITSSLEETSAQGTQSEVIVFNKKAEKEQIITDALKGVKNVGISGSGLTYRMLQEVHKLTKAGLTDVTKAIEHARQIKDAQELERTREACRIASQVGDMMPEMLREGMTEFEVAAEVNYRMQKGGASDTAFATNASFGPNSAEPHHSTGPSKLRKGQFALIDFGALYKRYCSDITRTFFIGSATEEQKEMYKAVQEAQLAGFAAIRAGVNGKAVDAAARKIIDATKFKGLMIHSLGHGLGLSVHDGGMMSPEVDLILEENMILTVEPGVYIRGKGGVRIEDDIRVTKRGCEVLTTASRDMMVI